MSAISDCGVLEEARTPHIRRKDLHLPESRLAAAMIQQAFEDLTLYPTPHDPPGVCIIKNAARVDARRWLLDTTSTDAHSLHQACLTIAISTGIRLDPEDVAHAVLSGVTFTGDNTIRRSVGAKVGRRVSLARVSWRLARCE